MQQQSRAHRTWSPSAGFRPLSATFGSVGLVASAISTSFMLTVEPEFYEISAVVTSVIFAVANLWFTFARKPKRWMAISQAVIFAILGLLMSILSDPSHATGPVVYALAIVLLVVQSRLSSLKLISFLLVAALIIDTAVAMIQSPDAIRDVIGTAIISIGVFAVVIFGVTLEVARMLTAETRSPASGRDTAQTEP